MSTRHVDLHITRNWWEWRKICEKNSRKLSALTFKVYEYLSPSIHFPFTFYYFCSASPFYHSFIHLPSKRFKNEGEHIKKHDNNDDDDKKWFDTPHKNVTKCVYFSLVFLLPHLFIFFSFHFWKHERKHACVYFFRDWAKVKIKKLNFFFWKYLIYASSEIEIFISFYLLRGRNLKKLEIGANFEWLSTFRIRQV